MSGGQSIRQKEFASVLEPVYVWSRRFSAPTAIQTRRTKQKMAIAIRDWTKQIEDLTVMGLDQLHETYSEMLATAHDIGYVVPDEQLVETEDDTVLREVIAKLHPEIVAYAAEHDREVTPEPTKKPVPVREKPAPKPARVAKPKAPPKVAEKATSTVDPKKPAKTVAQKGSKNEDNTMNATAKKAKPAKVAKKTAKTAPAKKAAKGAKKAAANARTPATRSKFSDDQTIMVKLKENPGREGSGRHDRIANMMKHSGKTVGAFIKSGGKTATLSHSVAQGWITVK